MTVKAVRSKQDDGRKKWSEAGSYVAMQDMKAGGKTADCTAAKLKCNVRTKTSPFRRPAGWNRLGR